jgi:hypothetical protein
MSRDRAVKRAILILLSLPAVGAVAWLASWNIVILRAHGIDRKLRDAASQAEQALTLMKNTLPADPSAASDFVLEHPQVLSGVEASLDSVASNLSLLEAQLSGAIALLVRLKAPKSYTPNNIRYARSTLASAYGEVQILEDVTNRRDRDRFRDANERRESAQVLPKRPGQPKPDQTQLTQEQTTLYRVIRVTSDDVLNMRIGPGVNSSILARIPFDAVDIAFSGERVEVNGVGWYRVDWNGYSGWVSSYYLSAEPKSR